MRLIYQSKVGGKGSAEAEVASREEEPLLFGCLRLAGELAGQLLVELPGPGDQGSDQVSRKASGPFSWTMSAGSHHSRTGWSKPDSRRVASSR